MVEGVRGRAAARDATVYLCDRNGEHKGQGLLLDLGEEEVAVLTCHHVIAPVGAEDLRVKVRQSDGQLGEPMPVRYDEERSRPATDTVVLRFDKARIADKRPLERRPLLHQLDFDEYEGSLNATVLTYLQPDIFGAKIGWGTLLRVPADTPPAGAQIEAPERYEVRAFLLRESDETREGISGGVVLCEGGVLGLVHFGRAEGPTHARQGYVVPLTEWAKGWPALARAIEPLVDGNLRNAARVKRANALEVGEDALIAGYRSDIYLEREADRLASTALDQNGGVVIVGRPMSGKTRLAWELLRGQEDALVVIPKPGSSRPPDVFEEAGLVGNNVVLFFDDLHNVASTMEPLEWRDRLEEVSKRNCLLICTARDGSDWERVDKEQSRLLDELGADSSVFASKVGGPGEEKGEDVSSEQARQLGEAVGLSDEEFDQRFDGTFGSVVLDLNRMGRRYRVLSNDWRGDVSMSRLLDSAKLLYEARQPSLHAPTLRAVAEEIRAQVA